MSGKLRADFSPLKLDAETLEEARRRIRYSIEHPDIEGLVSHEAGIAQLLLAHIAALEAELATLEQDAEEVRLLREMAAHPNNPEMILYTNPDRGVKSRYQCRYCEGRDHHHKDTCPWLRLQKLREGEDDTQGQPEGESR